MTTGAGPPRPPPPPPRPPPPAPPEFGSRVSQYCALGVGSLLALSRDRKSTRLNSSHSQISYAVFCLTKKRITACPKEIIAVPVGRRCGYGITLGGRCERSAGSSRSPW